MQNEVVAIPKIWDVLPDLYRAVRELHKKHSTGGGHAFGHDEQVAQLVLYLGWGIYPERDVVIAAAAALCHSGDWIWSERFQLGKDGNLTKAPQEDFRMLATDLLFNKTDFSREEIQRAQNASVYHHKKDDEIEDIVDTLVAEADRAANMMLTVIIRGGQHAVKLQPLNPVHGEIDPSDRPYREKYAHPDSVLWDLANCADWGDKPNNPYGFKTPRGKELGKELAVELRLFIEKVKAQERKMGLMIPRPE